MHNTVVSFLRKLAAEAERRGLDDISYRIGSSLREIEAEETIRLAASKSESNIEVESWPDFLNWWNNNRGQNLIYIFMDSYGPDSEQVRLVKKLVRDAEKHEKDLHEFYRTLRDLASQKMDMDPGQSSSPPPSDQEEDFSLESPAEDDSDGEVNALDEIALDLE